MRILLCTLFRVRNVNKGEVLNGFRLRLCLRKMTVVLNGLDNLLADRLCRVQAGHRVLEDHGNFLAANLLHFFFVRGYDVVLAELHAALFNSCGRHGVQLHDGLRRDALAAAGLTDDGEHFALIEVEIDAPDGMQHFSTQIELDVTPRTALTSPA